MAKPTAAEVLNAAASLIEKPGAWVRDYTAMCSYVDKNGGTIYERRLAGDADANMWGGTGAIYREGMRRGLSPRECFEIQKLAAKQVGVETYFSDWAWSLGRTQSEVVGALRLAAQATA